MERTESLYEYLHYVLYNYLGCSDQDIEKKDVIDEIEEPLPVYLDVQDWRRYLPPLYLHNATALQKIRAGSGSCMVGDIMLNIPLIKIWNLLNRPTELKDVLGHFVEDQQLLNVPLCRLPKQVVVELTTRKRFMPRLTEDLILLSHLGLLSYGPRQRCNNMEFGSIFLHKKAILLDTRTSLPSHIMTKSPDGKSFPVLHYALDTREDLAQYWIDLQIISLNTQLGARKKADIPGNHGNVSLLSVSKPTTFEEIKKRTESDWLPGDRRGVAGLDSCLMTHMIRNWRKGVPQLQCSTRLKAIPVSTIPHLSQVQESEGNERKVPGQEDEPPSKKKKMAVAIKSKKSKSSLDADGLKKKKVSKPKSPKPKKRPDGISAYSSQFDAKDYKAMGAMRRIRSYFTPLENGLILLCQLAGYLLNPRYPCVNRTVIRDIMHENLPESHDKTTAAIKGKIARLSYDSNFKLHMAVFLAQVKSDKPLLAKYSGKQPLFQSPEMVSLYRQLVMDLKKKFSTPKHTQEISLPECVQHLNQNYKVENTAKMFDISNFDEPLKTLADIRTLVCAELIETFLHLDSLLSSVSIYITFSKFDDQELIEAYESLKTREVIVKLKRSEKDQKRLVTNTAILNSYKCKKVHQEAIRSLLPEKIFFNVGQVIRLLQRPSSDVPRTTTPKSSTSTTFSPVSLTQSDISQTRPKDEENIETNLDNNDASKEDDKNEHFVSLEIEKLQGGASLSVVCLAAVDLIKMDLKIPDENVVLDKVGQRKLGLDNPKVSRRRPTTLEKGPDGKRIVKRSLKKRHLDSEDEEQNEYSTVMWPLSRKFATTECPLTGNAKISLQQQQRFMARQQGSSPAASPASSIKVQEKTTDKEGGQETDKVDPRYIAETDQGADTVTARDCEMRTCALPTAGDTSNTIPLGTSVAINATSNGTNSSSHCGSNTVVGPINSGTGESIILLPSMQLRYHSNNKEESSVNHLPRFVAWVASSCLMTLARTSYIHRLNLMVADCAIGRHFSLVPMKTQFYLKITDKSTSGTSVSLNTFSSIQNSSVSLESSNAEDRSRLVEEMDLDKATASEQDPCLSQTLGRISMENHGKDAWRIHNSPKTSEAVKLPVECRRKSKIGEGVVPQETFLSNFGEPDKYKALIERLEMCFQSADLDKDIDQAELVALLPTHIVDDGLKLYSLLDAAGAMGMDERDVQAQMSIPWLSLQEIVTPLARGNAVLKAGHTWRRLVGRRHFRPWLVEVPDAGLGDGALSTETGPKKPDGTESANSVLYQVRPWRSFHKGRINVAGLRRVLERVLSDVMVKPGQTVTSLCHQLNPHFLSAVTLDALEILEEIGCVHSVFVSPRPKIDLFSKVSRKVSITTESNRGSTRVVDISVESPLRFASFLEAVHQHCQDPGTQ